MRKTRANYAMVAEDDPRWVKFWSAYEKRVAKKEARKAFGELNPSMELVDRICAALAWQFKQPDWRKQDCQFAPYPARYLRSERWTDEPPRQAKRSRLAEQCGVGGGTVIETLLGEVGDDTNG